MTMVATAKRIIGNENGFVLGASILISAILLLAGVLALWTSNTEMHVVRNEGDLTLEFYNAEGGSDRRPGESTMRVDHGGG